MEKTLDYLVSLEPKSTRKQAIQFAIDLYCKLLSKEAVEMMSQEEQKYRQEQIYQAVTRKYQTTRPAGW